MDLFVYGTLQDEALVDRLTGHRFRRLPAVLSGYRRIELAGFYPWIEPAADGSVDGLILEEIDTDSLARFDEYECVGTLYERIEVSVSAGARLRTCQTYCGRPDALLRCPRE